MPSYEVRSSFIRASRWMLAVAALSAAWSAPVNAQSTGVIRGRVVEAASQRGISDVQVTVVGATLGAVTNANGEFVISTAPPGTAQLIVRRIGYGRRLQAVTVPQSGTVTVNFELSTVASQLDAVVVTGTGGAVERRTLGNSLTTLDVANLTEKQTVANVTEILQGKTAGVSILPGSGAPGTAGEIRIRGASSLAGYKPVVFIDGIRYNIDDLGSFSATGGGTAGLAQSSQVTSALNNLNPQDIESIEIVKGPAAATLYGADAANGVIQIITKKGNRGQQQLRWNFRGESGKSDWNRLPEDNYTTCDAARKALTVSATDTTHVWPGCINLRSYETLLGGGASAGDPIPVNGIVTDNPLKRDDRALREGVFHKMSANLRGGGERYSFYVAGDRANEQGVFFNSDNSNTSLRSNFGFNPNAKSDLNISVNYQNGRLRLPIQDESANGLLLSARRGMPGRRSFLGEGNEGWRTIAPPQSNRYKNFTETERLTLSATTSYQMFSWLQHRFIAGIDNTNTQAELLFLPGDVDIAQDPDAGTGAKLRANPRREVMTLDYAGTIKTQPMATLSSDTKFGAQVIRDQSENLRATGIGIGSGDITLINLLLRSTGAESFSENNSVGYYLQEQLAWNDRLYLTGAVRADDHSAFGANFNTIFYPKLSVSYVISDEPFAKDFLGRVGVNSLKLRSAWGQAGRAPTAYSAPQTYTVDRVALGVNTAAALRPLSYGNPDLKPERGEEIEVGFEGSFFDERFGTDFTYYNKTTMDMLQAISIPPSTGFISTRLVNLGEVTNKGIELSIFGTPLKRGSLAWDTRLNISTNKNALVNFGGVPGKVLESPTGQAYGAVQQHRPGYPLGGFWVTPPQRDAEGAAILTSSGAAIFNPGDTARRYIGPSTPTREWGFSNTVTLMKGVRVYALLDGKSGFYVFNLQERNRCQFNDNCWRVNNPATRFPVTHADSIQFKEIAVYKNSSISPEWIQKGDFMKLREISLTLDIPRMLLGRSGAQSGSFVISGRNLGLWSDYEGVDPEVNSYGGRNFARVDAYAAPATRRWTAAFNLQF